VLNCSGLYVLYCLGLELQLLQGHCINCYYSGYLGEKNVVVTDFGMPPIYTAASMAVKIRLVSFWLQIGIYVKIVNILLKFSLF
jgi:hypothetical protein